MSNPPNYSQPGPGQYVPPSDPKFQSNVVMQPPQMAQQGSHPGVAPPAMPAQSASQIGEQYRAELFAQCAQGRHDPKTKYGMCGIITAIACFPCGLICLFSDSEQRCTRCGVRLDK
ncbi:hypothetical protein BDP27DRAFT_1443640 [Rhodocollybia butyracea]|uniref:Uncharacterized protein n=1 Tax=Rhodocollybia butyracea TaxID=206335 RepID=A0A9P5PZ94_9AGAR|nr:hypothetical protein BDP27DRAFT_1443640 [Rhodocollybia butyracea]